MESQARGEAAGEHEQPTLLDTDVSGAKLFRISRRTFRERCAAGIIPPPIVLGPRIVRWVRADLERALAAMPRQKQAVEPAQLRRGKIEALKRGVGAEFSQ